jgi:hypothetical protein
LLSSLDRLQVTMAQVIRWPASKEAASTTYYELVLLL